MIKLIRLLLIVPAVGLAAGCTPRVIVMTERAPSAREANLRDQVISLEMENAALRAANDHLRHIQNR